MIVGGPHQRGETYDLEVDFTLHEAGGPVKSASRLTRLTGGRILDLPFAFTGKVSPLRWEAEVKLAYRGQTLSFHHTSALLMPGIPVFRALVYNPERLKISPQEASAPVQTGMPDVWKVYPYVPQRQPNLKHPHFVPLFELYREQLQAGDPLAAYLAVTITSPSDQGASLLYQAAGEPQFYLEGRRLKQASLEAPELGQGYFPRLFSPMLLPGLQLKAGKNVLLIGLRPAEVAEWRPWYFGGMLLDDQNRLLTDLSYSAE